VLAVIAVLTAVVAGLGVANAVQGPRLRQADLNTAALVDRSGGRISLSLTQRLSAESVARVSISPAAGMSATMQGDVLDLTVTEPLKYGTSTP
jgi:hypothetical protein